MPGCILKKIGNLGIPEFETPWCLIVILDPIFGGFLLYLSSNPEPTLKVCPSTHDLTTKAPSISEHLPVPF